MNDYNVIVVGAGPAGATAARNCAKGGLKTLLLEKEEVPREKRCGGGISSGTLKELDFELPEDIVERRCVGMRAIQGKVKNEVRVSHCVATMVTRSKFDAFLIEKAVESGAKLQQKEPCLSVKVTGDGVKVTTSSGEYSADAVIGADGVYSVVAKSFRPPFSQEELRYCIVADVPMEKEKLDKFLPDMVELHYGYIDMGYAWLFPKKDYIAAGVAGAFTQAKGLKEKFKGFLKLHGFDENVQFKGCLIPISKFKNDSYSDRIILTGDAAGFVDCFSGEGIRFAVASGKYAAGTLIKARKENDFSKEFLKNYQDAFYKEFKGDLKSSILLTNLSFRYPDMLLGTLIRNDDVIVNYYKVMSAEMTFRQYMRWLMPRVPYFILKRLFGKKN